MSSQFLRDEKQVRWLQTLQNTVTGGNSVKNYHANHRKTELGKMMNSVYK